MAVKKKSGAAGAGTRASAQKIWLAGVGALASAEEEGSKLFDTLVAKGRAYREEIGVSADDAQGRLKETVAEVRGRAGRTWQRVENVFDQQVTSTLHRLGVPTRREVTELTRRVEALTRKIDGIGRKPARKVKKATTKKSTKKVAKKTKTGAAKKKTTSKKKKTASKKRS